MNLFLQSLISAGAGALVSGLCWWIFQRQISRDDKSTERMEQDLRAVQSDVADLRDHRITQMEANIREKIEDLKGRMTGEAEARRRLEGEMVKQREFMLMRDDIRAILQRLELLNTEVAGVKTNMEMVMRNVQMKFGTEVAS